MSLDPRGWVPVSCIFLLLMPFASYASEGTSGLILGGSLNAPIRMEVFSDFECPGCRIFYREVIKPVLQDYASGDKVCVIYYEDPLPYHRYSQKAAKYCEAAYKLGRDKAVKVAGALFARQDDWKKDGNIEAVIAGVLPPEDILKIRKMLMDPGLQKSIDRGISLANSRGVGGTPTLFLYYHGKEQRVNNPHELRYPTVKQFIEKVLD